MKSVLRGFGNIKVILLSGLAASCATTGSPRNAERAQTLYQIGVSLLEDGRYPESLGQLQAAWELDSTRPEILMHMGLANLQLERLPEAERDITRACEMQRDFPDCWNNLSFVRIRSRKYTEAVAAADRALSAPTYATPSLALMNRGRALVELKKFRAAQASFDKAIRLSSDNCQIRDQLILLHARENDAEAALSEALRTQSFCPNDPMSILWEAYSLYKLGHRQRAEQRYRDIIDTFHQGEITEQSRVALEKLKKRLPLDEPNS